jgi:lipoate-protein ligase A
MTPTRLHLDHTYARPEENLAADEALLSWCMDHPGTEILRFWESPSLFVVLGHGNRTGSEVNMEACQKQGIPVLRRCSGGGTVLQGPGCLNYALILQIDLHPELHSVTSTNASIMERNRSILTPLAPAPLSIQGHTDLVLQGRKFSGNAQKRTRSHILFHGTFLLSMDLQQIRQALHHPSMEPGYRAGRDHDAFLRHFPATSKDIRNHMKSGWQSLAPFTSPLDDHLQPLLNERYNLNSWNLKR